MASLPEADVAAHLLNLPQCLRFHDVFLEEALVGQLIDTRVADVCLQDADHTHVEAQTVLILDFSNDVGISFGRCRLLLVKRDIQIVRILRRAKPCILQVLHAPRRVDIACS